jgi:hypothetical protein
MNIVLENYAINYQKNIILVFIYRSNMKLKTIDGLKHHVIKTLGT